MPTIKNLRSNTRTYSWIRGTVLACDAMNTFLLTRIQQKSTYNKVTRWFHTLIKGKEQEGTPAETIMEMNDLFLDLLKKKNLNLGATERVFRRNMCNALCTMIYYGDIDICKKNPVGTYPPGWNYELEIMWKEWLEIRCFKNWTAFWARIPVREWEDALPGWRSVMEHILMSYVEREIYILVDDDIIIEDEHGDYVDSNQYEYTEDRWD